MNPADTPPVLPEEVVDAVRGAWSQASDNFKDEFHAMWNVIAPHVVLRADFDRLADMNQRLDERAITAESATRQARQLSILRDFASRVGQTVGIAFTPTDDGEVYTPDNLSGALWQVRQLTERAHQRASHVRIDPDGPAAAGLPDHVRDTLRRTQPLDGGPYLVNLPSVGYLGSGEWTSTRFRTAAQQISTGRGGWGSNMRAALSALLDNAAEALEQARAATEARDREERS